MFRTGVQMLLLVVLVGLFLLRESQQWPGETVDQRWTDCLSLNCGKPSHGQTPPVTLIAIDDTSLTTHPWPWTPLDFSLFYQAALPFNQRCSVSTRSWSGTTLHPRGGSGQTPAVRADPEGRAADVPEAAARLAPRNSGRSAGNSANRRRVRFSGMCRAISRADPRVSRIDRQPKEEYRLSATLGFVNIPARQYPTSMIPLVLKYRGQVVPSFCSRRRFSGEVLRKKSRSSSDRTSRLAKAADPDQRTRRDAHELGGAEDDFQL